MASIKFRVRATKKEDATIYVHFINGRNHKYEINSGIKIANSDWFNKDLQATKPISTDFRERKNNRKIDKALEAVDSQILLLRGEIKDEIETKPEISKAWLKGIVDRVIHKKVDEPEGEPTLSAMVTTYANYIANQKGGGRAPGTVRSYGVCKMRIDKFDKYSERVHALSEINVKYMGEFIQWARTVEKYSPASYLKTLKMIKTVLRRARVSGHKIDNLILDESTEQEDNVKLRPIYLTIDEIEKIREFRGEPSLENARDWLVIACWTACRVGDLLNLTNENLFITKTGERIIQYRQGKTTKDVTVPVFEPVKEIFTRRDGNFPDKIPAAVFNRLIKKVCLLAGITQVVEGERITLNEDGERRKERMRAAKYTFITSHTGRRSFITNHLQEIPNEFIRAVTGHATDRQMYEYVGETPKKHVSKFYDTYDRMMDERKQKAAAAI